MIFIVIGIQAQNTVLPGKSEWVYPGKDGKLMYKTTPMGDKIMDFSYAGYMGGGVALPDVPLKITIQPSGAADETANIQAAIDKVAALPFENGFRGAVLLSPGIYPCSGALTLTASGVVLRGNGSGENGSTIKMIGDRHAAVTVGIRRNRGENGRRQDADSGLFCTKIADAYVSSGTMSFNVADAKGFAEGDMIEIRKPVTKAWVHFMQMDDMVRNGKPQTWMSEGTEIITRRFIAKIQGNRLTLDVPLTDGFDAKYLDPPGTLVVKITPPAMVAQVGVENLHIQAPAMEKSYHDVPYTALRINGVDCWARDILIEETMNSVSIGGRRITLERVIVTRTVPNLGASKPAEFAPNAGQVLLDRCSSIGDNIWHAATGAGQAGPIVLLNCSFGGNGHIEGHQRWTTGILTDNCRLPGGGIDFKNRGEMGSGHGWGTAWSVAWNCKAKSYVIQQPPGAYNWMIGCTGPNLPTPRPFSTGPTLPLGVSDSPGIPVEPQSLYLAQLKERLGQQAIRNIGYDKPGMFDQPGRPDVGRFKPVVDEEFGLDLAAHMYANPSNVKSGGKFGGEKALDNDPDTYWTTNDNVTSATLEVDIETPGNVGIIEIHEAKGFENRIQEYKVEGMVDSDWKLLSLGTTIGAKKVDITAPAKVWKVRLVVLKATAPPAISRFSLYKRNE